MKSSELTLYYTEACHLCECAKQVFENVRQKQEQIDRIIWNLECVDIANDEALFEQYGVRIPVVKVTGADLDLGWPFDERMLDEYLLSM